MTPKDDTVGYITGGVIRDITGDTNSRQLRQSSLAL
jgi:hypothetical protein